MFKLISHESNKSHIFTVQRDRHVNSYCGSEAILIAVLHDGELPTSGYFSKTNI